MLEIDSAGAATDWGNGRPRPPRLYFSAEGDDVTERTLENTESSDTCVNDCFIHPLIPELPFRGAGNSGMGKYHGRYGFEAFTNARGVLYQGAKLDPAVKYPPYSGYEQMRGLIGKLMP